MQAAEPPEQPRSPGAERMARHRQRRKQGLRSIPIELREAEIDTLIRRGLLTADSRSDVEAIKRAVHGFLDDTLK
jgi:hypothetical protein